MIRRGIMKITNAFDGTKAKLGDEVYSIKYGKGVVGDISSDGHLKPIGCIFMRNGETARFLMDGRYQEYEPLPDLYYGPPEIIGPPKPKRIVKRTVEVWANVYKNGEYRVHHNQDAARLSRDTECLTCIPLTGTYEVEED
jgi:hypothetical protein